MDKLLLTPEETATTLSVGRSKVYELIARGELASVRIGGSRRIPVEAVTEFVRRLASDPAGGEPELLRGRTPLPVIADDGAQEARAG